jgi:hypothetical protein
MPIGLVFGSPDSCGYSLKQANGRLDVHVSPVAVQPGRGSAQIVHIPRYVFRFRYFTQLKRARRVRNVGSQHVKPVQLNPIADQFCGKRVACPKRENWLNRRG